MKRAETSRISLLIGDTFLVEEKEKALVQSIQTNTKGEVAVQTVYLSDTPLEKLLTQARTLPFLVSAQVFLVREAERLKKADLEVLEPFLKEPPDTVFVIFESFQMDGRHVMPKFVANYGNVVLLEDAQARSAVSRFIREKLKQFGKTMTPSAQRLLEEEVGEMPSFLDSILTQLIFYADSKDVIDDDMVETFRERLDHVNGFQITDAIAGQNTGKALKMLHRFIEENDKEIIPFLGLLHWQMRRLWMARVMFEKGTNERAILSKCKVWGRATSGFMSQVKRLERAKLEAGLQGLLDLDWKLKSGRTDASTGLESWMVKATT